MWKGQKVHFRASKGLSQDLALPPSLPAAQRSNGPIVLSLSPCPAAFSAGGAPPPRAWPAASSETRACETGANASVTRRRLWTPRVMWLVSRGRALVYLYVCVCLASRVAAMPACACLRVGAASFGLPRSILSTVLSVVVVVRCGLAALRTLLDETT